ncbi:phage major capsid protein [Streptomyces sp. SLBN-115]|uniref:phage major capsid protein n=1 Tax=Streptomyces sp. SLBN-115 TaxID=2768453 RepID=UPI00115436D8|nr:phage major capsid protein [Streptomyces sp. SLBN-115]TQJ56007.1 HK97 family phage major capsid protein [Streptomyces sp. SLBN-115]
MKIELRKVFESAESGNRGLSAHEIAAVINSTDIGTEARAEALAMINGGRARTIEGRDALRTVLEADAATAVEHAEHRARTEAFENEVRRLVANQGNLLTPTPNAGGDRDSWRSILPSGNEYRALVNEGTPGAGGYAVPTDVANRAVEFLRAKSVFMQVPGLNIHRFTGGTFVLPNLISTTTPGVVAEGALIPSATANFGGFSFAPMKYADLYEASNEILEDAAFDMRDLIATVMLRNVAAQVDRDAFQGTGTASLSGLTKAGMGTAVNLASGTTQVSWDHVIDAYSDIEAVGAAPAVIWASPDQAKGLRKARENGNNGGYLAGQVTDPVASRGLGLPIHVSGNLPQRTVIVADPTRIHVGVRSDVRIARSEDYGFAQDKTAFKATYRIAGLVVDAPAAVQIIKASAS